LCQALSQVRAQSCALPRAEIALPPEVVLDFADLDVDSAIPLVLLSQASRAPPRAIA
jgi:hypothetical protein